MAHLSLAVIATFPYIGACIVFVFQFFSPSLLQNRKHQKTFFSSNKHFKDVAEFSAEWIVCLLSHLTPLPSLACARLSQRRKSRLPATCWRKLIFLIE